MAVLEVDKKMLGELEAMGFPRPRATRALHYSGNASLGAAIDWIVDHENDADIDEMPLVTVDISIGSPEPFYFTEGMKIKAQELRRGFNLLERRVNLGLPPGQLEGEKHTPAVRIEQNPFPVRSVAKSERMRECLRSLRRNHKDDDARVRQAFQTLLIYVGNVARNPNEEKFRKIRLSNPLFFDRVGSLIGGIEFLELCGFETTEGGEFLYLPDNKVDMATLNSAASELKSALTNPFFGLL
ncbi:UBX domain-containing protein 1-like [Prunus yedoensis var. nudiflora]|uniref:UBX domain-containing protein 1-like n=1 Tax=Prunus yedoensis var. nudiflora TaxID=2094558 RepID=A0A314XWC9_PRUYE|nr:UBX domain-containing protein 1-like [Prunus yedoensis var. nudiflora]